MMVALETLSPLVALPFKIRLLFIGFIVAILFCTSDLSPAQENPTQSHGSPPFLKQCGDKNPPPCADKPPTPNHAPDPQCSRDADKAKTHGIVVLEL